MDGLGFDQVVVIEDEDNPFGESGNFVEQRSQDSLSWRLLRGLKRTQCSFSNIGFNCPQGSDEIDQEADRVVVPFV